MEKADIERRLFCYMCGTELAEKMTVDRGLTYEEFDQVVYILMQLKFYGLLLDVWNEYYDHFKLEIENLNELIDQSEEDHIKYTLWLKEFCDHAPSRKMKKILKEIFEL